MLKDAWDPRGDQAKQAQTTLKRQFKELDQQQDSLVERLIETTSTKVLTAVLFLHHSKSYTNVQLAKLCAHHFPK
ncbi:hypothetical protein [Amylibacter sp. SFDW26]|uniref:hypothetical protein n=1 Tax=Amylibacter sp. SFDW26 TaxID=2652722 RepID=UPI00186A2022|nr:hypothetical protein [Amylibacter sp. SFDW26]